MSPVEVMRGDSPIILGVPHTGMEVPVAILETFNEEGRALADTDWHIDRLYDGLAPSATMVRATFHRYVIDANRDPSGESLYPGQNTTGLYPLTDFDGQPIYRDGMVPDEAEVARRIADYHTPYHAALDAEIARVKAIHGYAILYDCHSIRSVIPFLFEGTLPDFNIGTNDGATCALEIERCLAEICADASGFTSVVNGRFKGGWTTRNYGRPETGVHAVQMELAQSTYLADEMPPWTYDATKAERLRAVLRDILSALETAL